MNHGNTTQKTNINENVLFDRALTNVWRLFMLCNLYKYVKKCITMLVIVSRLNFYLEHSNFSYKHYAAFTGSSCVAYITRLILKQFKTPNKR